jgi:hypothetical protein
LSTAVSPLPITKYPITTRLTTDHRPRYRYRRDSRRCKPRGSTCKPRGTPAGSTSAVSPTRRTNQSSENSWATRWRRCVHLNFFLVIFGYFWLFLVIFGNIRMVNQTESLVFCHVQVGGTSQAYDPGNNITCVLSVYINREKQFAFVEFRTVAEASNAMVRLF